MPSPNDLQWAKQLASAYQKRADAQQDVDPALPIDFSDHSPRQWEAIDREISAEFRAEVEVYLRDMEQRRLIPKLIAKAEAHGFTPRRPGDLSWLPDEDWDDGTLVATNHTHLYVLNLRPKPGVTGATRRLFAAALQRGFDIRFDRTIDAEMLREGFDMIREQLLARGWTAGDDGWLHAPGKVAANE